MQSAPFKPLVIGAPRGGFTLLISVLSQLTAVLPTEASLRKQLVRRLVDLFGGHIANEVARVIGEAGREADLVYSPNFRHMVGGPKWLDKRDSQRACFRKYVGVRGLGDFTLITSHPREVLEYDPVVHCHIEPARWLAEPGYADFNKFAAYRSPIGVIASSLLSINALTSEYIQKFVPPEQDNHRLREHLALFKFTNLDFFRGLVAFYKDWYEEFIEVRDSFVTMRWEDLLTDPNATISGLAEAAGVPYVDAHHAAEIWAGIDHRNMTGAHKHNLRPGGGKVGDWKNWMTNRHLDILREEGFDAIMAALDYGAIPELDESRYTPFQNQIDALVACGEVYEDYPDRDLFGFAFNKSNIDSSRFAFKRYGWREATQVERSDFKDEGLMNACWDAAEAAALRINRLFDSLLAVPMANRAEVTAWIAGFADAAGELSRKMPKAFEAAGPSLAKIADDWFDAREAGLAAPDGHGPRLIRPFGPFALAKFRNRFHAIPMSAGTVDLDATGGRPVSGGAVRDTYVELIETIMAPVREFQQTGRMSPIEPEATRD